jgi:hypothetical protein
VTRYLQRLIERTSGAGGPSFPTPVVRAARQADAGREEGDPFERTAPHAPQPLAPPVPQVDVLRSRALPLPPAASATDAFGVRHPVPLPAERAPEPRRFTPVEPPQTELEKTVPRAKSARPAIHEPEPVFEPVRYARLTPDERPTLPNQTPPPPLREQPEQAAPHLPRLEALVQSGGRARKTAHPDAAPRSQPLDPPPVANVPLEKEKAVEEQPVPDLHPLPPAPPPATKPVPQQPRVVIGHLSVEVVPAPSTISQPIPARPVQSTRVPERSEPTPGSMLRFGLGQM